MNYRDLAITIMTRLDKDEFLYVIEELTSYFCFGYGGPPYPYNKGDSLKRCQCENDE